MQRLNSVSSLRILCTRHVLESTRQFSILSSWKNKLSNIFSAETQSFTIVDATTSPKQFKVLSDTEIIGGKSDGQVTLAGKTTEAFLRMSGTLDMEAAEGYKKSGFCNFRYNMKGPVEMGDYKGLELEVRSDGRDYMLQMHIESMLPEDIYHAKLSIPSRHNEWTKLRISFKTFQAVFMGYPKEVQRQLDNFEIKALGILIADDVPGAFQLDIRSIKAIPKQE